jgi:hypothetical protein
MSKIEIQSMKTSGDYKALKIFNLLKKYTGANRTNCVLSHFRFNRNSFDILVPVQSLMNLLSHFCPYVYTHIDIS